jgi:hypothetical protein
MIDTLPVFTQIPNYLGSLMRGNLTLIITALLILCFIYVIRKLFSLIDTLKSPSVLLELTPPATTEKSAYTTQQLFSVLHSLGSNRTLSDKIIGRKAIFSFEITSSQNQGIRYLLRTKQQHVANIKRSILSYLPFVALKVVSEYIPMKSTLRDKASKVDEFSLAKHFAYPLKKQDLLYEHDPVAYITGMMTKLSPGELISFQVVISPTKRRETKSLAKMILRNEDILSRLDRKFFTQFSSPITFPVFLISKVVQILASQIQWALTELSRDTSRNAINAYTLNGQSVPQNLTKPARVLSTFEEEVITSIHEKIEQSLFETTLRVLIVLKETTETKERRQGFHASLATYSIPKLQSITRKPTFPAYLTDRIRLFSFRSRLHTLFFNTSSTILSSSEIADLYHFPFTRVTQTENIVKVHSKQLPAPLSLKNNPKLDVVFAKNTYAGTETVIGLTKEERVRHMYVIGATGTGKSTMLLSMINQDLQNGKGVGVVDPHGDLAETIISCIPEVRKNDLIYFNPIDIKYPIGINLLELTPGLEEDDALIEKEFIAESVISLFRKMFSDGKSGHPHRIEYILRNTIHTAFTIPNPTLFTIFDLLNNPVFQKKAMQGIQDENLRNFWKYEFGKAGDYQKVKMVAPVTSRIGRFLFSPSAKRILEQERSTINFDEILDKEKILICNLSKGNLGEDTSEVMGIMILNKLQLAALKRSGIAQKDRKDFYLYVDEFQNFATPSFVQMLSEARKYGLNLTMAEQSTSQQKDKNLVQIVLANTGTVVTFRSANPQDEELLLPQYRPYVDFGEIANLPAYRFYMKTAAIKPEEPFSGTTIPVAVKVDKEKKERFIQTSRKLYAHAYIAKKQNITKVEISRNKEGEKQQNTKVKSGLPA